ncbi:MAG: ATP-binding cassette domain-containing protein [Vicinamibacterales bacterium]
MVELVDLRKAYDGVPAVDGVTTGFRRGATTLVIGPSGCGKSTVLRTIAGLVTPDSGRLHFDGEPVDRARWPAIRQRIGYVIQEGGLFPHLTIGRNVSLMARHLRWPAARIAARVDELVGLTQLPTDLLRRYPGELSGGQRQRASLMRALMLDPDLLLLDEPLGALDPMIRYDVQQELKALFGRLRKTVVMVTHDLSEAAVLADDVVLMRAGRIVQRGPLATLAGQPAEPFVSQFISAQRAPMQHLVSLLG